MERPCGAHDVAALIIKSQRAGGRTVDKMQLEKLLYFVDGAHLQLWGTRAIRETPRAYKRGPVYRNVEETYRHLPHDDITEPIGGRPDQVPSAIAATVDLVLRRMGSWDALTLEGACKAPDSPWRAARKGIPDSEPSSEQLDVSDMSKWFHAHGLPAASNDGPPPEMDQFLAAASGDLEAFELLVR